MGQLPSIVNIMKTLWVILLHIGFIGLSQSVRQAKMCKDCWTKRSAATEVPEKRADSMWEFNRMGGKIKRSNPDYTNFPEPFRPLPENKEEDKVIIDAKRSAGAKNEEKRSNSMWELNRMGGGGKHKRAADYTNFSNDLFRPLPENKVEDDSIKEVKRDDYTNFPEPFRPLPENKKEEKVIIDAKRLADAKNEEKRSNSMWELNRMGGGGKHKRAADYTNFSDDLFRPLPENKVEEDSIKEVKRDSEEKRSAQGEFHRAVVFKPSGKRQGLGKRSDECATNSPTV